MQVTVVVPTRNSGRTIAACLDSLRNQTHPCTIVVVDNASSDDTIALAALRADVVHAAGPERSAQRNAGARLRPADVVGFIDSDMVLAKDVVRQAVEAITAGAAGVIVPERTIGTGYWSAVRAFERSFYSGSDNIEAARFYQWTLFDKTGGFDENLTGPEDLDLTIRVRRQAPITRITAMIDHDEGHLRYCDSCKKKGYYAEGMRRYVAKYGSGAMRDWARRPWLHQPRQMLSLAGLGLIVLKVGETATVISALARSRLGSRP